MENDTNAPDVGNKDGLAGGDVATPGPWELGAKAVFSDGDGLTFSGGEYNIFPPLGESGPVAVVANNEANARRIAAAPELLDALCNLLFASENADETGYITDVGFLDIDSIREKARAAIAKANGTEPANQGLGGNPPPKST